MPGGRDDEANHGDFTPPTGKRTPFGGANTLGPTPTPRRKDPFAGGANTVGPRPSDKRPAPDRSTGRSSDRIAVTTELDALDDEIDDDDEWYDEPNYLIRRAILLAIILVGIVVAFVVITQVLGSDDDDTAADTATSWDTVIVLTDDEIRLLDRDGLDELDVINVETGLLDAQSLVAGNTLVTMTDEGRITQIDLTEGTRRRGRAGLDETLRPSAGNPEVALVAPDGGGDVTIVDTIHNSVLSVADVAGLDAPLIFADQVQVNAAGTHVAIPVPNEFQSFVIDLQDETVEAYAGRVIAIDDTRVVTEQPAGAESEIEFHELGGDRLGTVDVPTPQATLLVNGGALMLVAEDGSVRSATDDGEVSDLDQLVDPVGDDLTVFGGTGVLGGQRLLLATSNGVVLVDADGAQLAAVEGSFATIPTAQNACIVVATGASTQPSNLLDLETGDVLTEIDSGLVTISSIDGCTAGISGGPSPRLLSDGAIVEVDARAIEAIAPDGAAYVVLDGRDSEYLEIGSDDLTEIADEPAVIRFGER
ncbi:MAG: hypothetical protein AB8G26_12870 [Ilumatobacter sp.]